MSASAPLPQPRRPAGTPSAPLLFVFLAGILAVTGLILVLASGPTWVLVGVTLGAMLVFLVLVLVVTGRLMSDDEEDHRPAT